jgi:hypothetical protein
VRKNAWFALGDHPQTLHDHFGSAENGRLRGFVSVIDKRKVLDLTLAEKLAEQSPSMNHIKETTANIVRMQHLSGARIQKSRHTPASLTVFNALHEACRQRILELEEDGKELGDGQQENLEALENSAAASGCQAVVAQALWPALVKFVGKGHASLTFANSMRRSAVWQQQACSSIELPFWHDSANRFPDALAAASKLLVHLYTQMFSELLIHTLKHPRLAAQIKLAEYDKDKGEQAPNCKVEAIDKEESHALARCLIIAALRVDSGAALFDEGLRTSFSNNDNAPLRKVKRLMGAGSLVWAACVLHLASLNIIAPSPNDAACYRAQPSDDAREMLAALNWNPSDAAWVSLQWRRVTG